MTAKELRVGSWLMFSNKIQPNRFIQVDATFFRSFSIEDGLELSGYYSPIPLTPEILQKAGFVKRRNSYGKVTEQYRHIKTDPVVLVETKQCWLVKTSSGNKLTSLNHIHQLQNLFFVITGEELEIKL